MNPKPACLDIGILVVNYKSTQHLKKLLASIEKQYGFDLKQSVPELNLNVFVYDSLEGKSQLFNEVYSPTANFCLNILTNEDTGAPLTYTQAINYLYTVSSFCEVVVILNPDTYFEDNYRALHLIVGGALKYPVANIVLNNQNPPSLSIGSTCVSLWGTFLENYTASNTVLTITGTGFTINRELFQPYYEGRGNNVFNPAFEMYCEDIELGLYMFLVTGEYIPVIGIQIEHVGGGSQSVATGDFCEERRFLACRNKAVMWGIHARSWLWFYFTTSLAAIIVEACYVLFKHPRRGFFALFNVYIPAFLSACTLWPIARYTINKPKRKVSDFKFLRYYGKLTLRN